MLVISLNCLSVLDVSVDECASDFTEFLTVDERTKPVATYQFSRYSYLLLTSYLLLFELEPTILATARYSNSAL